MDFSNKTVLCLDSGLYLHVARKLSESFGTTLYYCPWATDGFPSEKRRSIGTGIPGVTRVMDLWSAARDADLVVVSDIYFHDETAQLRLMGKPVFGPGYAEALEIERLRCRLLMEAIGMDVIPYEALIGEDALKERLADKDDVWIKASVTRGDWETMHWQGEHLSRQLLERNLNNLGPRATKTEFVVEQSVKGHEIGFDGPCVLGAFSDISMWGCEAKDKGYLMKVQHLSEMPDRVINPTRQFAQLLQQFGLQGFYSNEIRIAEDGTPYMIDPCIRCGSPPSESYIELFSNWDEVIWAGAHGEMLTLEPIAKYAAQIVLKSLWVSQKGYNDYLPVYFPEEISRWVKLHGYCIVNGQVTVVPQAYEEFGAVIGIGDSKEEAIKMAEENADKIEAIELNYAHDVADTISEQLDEAKKYGVVF